MNDWIWSGLRKWWRQRLRSTKWPACLPTLNLLLAMAVFRVLWRVHSSQAGCISFVFPWIFNIMFGLNLPKGQLALEWTVPAPSAPAFPAPSSGSSLQNSQQLPHGACIKIIEALEWLGKAKESCNYYCIYVFHHFFHPFFFHQIMPFFPCILFEAKKLWWMTHPAQQLCSWRVPCGPSWLTSWTSSVN